MVWYESLNLCQVQKHNLHQVIRLNQILFYKSKSILEVSQIMIKQKEVKVMLVGALVLLFSVIFPISKLLSSFILILKPSLKNKNNKDFAACLPDRQVEPNQSHLP